MAERHIVIGTAGHIDHGKTMLVQALTGKNTDRLQEEQARGISIDIDFAPLRFADGTVAGIVDVPGHERFVKNMVAGAAGIDGALIVVDVNEGLMPQTYEHLAILELFGVTKGVIALTKADLADSELIDISSAVVREGLSGTPFADAPMIPTSVKTGAGLETLKDALYELVENCDVRDTTGAFRLPIDKVFSVPGFGTVVSGTVWRGRVQVGDSLEVLPERKEVRVRGIQVHGDKVDVAEAGQRAALNLTGVDKNQLRRGYAVSAPGTLQETQLLDAKIHVLEERERPLQHRDRVHFHLGTSEAIGTLLLLDGDVIEPGSEGYAQIQLDRPVVCDSLDFFVLRSYSPVTTVGGGRVIDPRPQRLHRRKRTNILEMLAERDSDTPAQRLLAVLRHGTCLTTAEIAAQLSLTEVETMALLEEAAAEERVVQLPSGWVRTAYVEETLSDMEHAVWALHQKHRFLTWVPRTSVLSAAANARSGQRGGFTQRDLIWLLDKGVEENRWLVYETRMKAVDWQVALTDEEASILKSLLMKLQHAELQPVSTQSLVQNFPKRDRVATALLEHAAETERVVEVSEGQWLHRDELTAAVERLQALYSEAGEFTVAMARDALSSNRKITVMLLEYLDEHKITHRRGDVRAIK